MLYQSRTSYKNGSSYSAQFEESFPITSDSRIHSSLDAKLLHCHECFSSRKATFQTTYAECEIPVPFQTTPFFEKATCVRVLRMPSAIGPAGFLLHMCTFSTLCQTRQLKMLHDTTKHFLSSVRTKNLVHVRWHERSQFSYISSRFEDIRHSL